MNFCGKFKGCVRETIVNCKGVSETEYKAILNIKSVNCSQKTAYLINVIDAEEESEVLAFMEKDNKCILRSILDGKTNGITSTYYEGKYLIHQISSVKINKHGNKEYIVKYYKLKQC